MFVTEILCCITIVLQRMLSCIIVAGKELKNPDKRKLFYVTDNTEKVDNLTLFTDV